MDGGAPRTPQPADRRIVNRAENRAEPAYRQPEESRIPADEPAKSSYRAQSRSAAPKEKKPAGKFWMIASIVLLVAIIGFAGWFFVSKQQGAAVGIDASKYQVVYLMNGQLYFGKLTQVDDQHYKLETVYYLQTPASNATDAEAATDAANDAQLVKLGNAIYGPEDQMTILKDQVLYYQNLKPDSRAAQLIENDK